MEARFDPLNSSVLIEDYRSIYSSINSKLESMKTSTVMVTGSSGMIASYLALFFIYLNEFQGFEMKLILTTTNKTKLSNKLGVYLECEYLYVEETDLSDFYNKSLNLNYIFHLASLASPHYYEKYPVEVILPNIVGTYNLIKLAINNSKDFNRFVFFSSYSIYGNINSDVINNSTETNMLFHQSNHIYGASKISGEILVSSYTKQYDLKGVIFRLAHSFGPGLDYYNDSRIFSRIIDSLINDEVLEIHSPSSTRTFTYLSDIIEGILGISLNKEVDLFYNIVNPINRVSNKEIVSYLAERYNLKYQITNFTSLDYVKSSIKVIPKTDCYNSFKSGWSPKVHWKTAFDRTIAYIRESEKNER